MICNAFIRGDSVSPDTTNPVSSLFLSMRLILLLPDVLKLNRNAFYNDHNNRFLQRVFCNLLYRIREKLRFNQKQFFCFINVINYIIISVVDFHFSKNLFIFNFCLKETFFIMCFQLISYYINQFIG